MSGLLGREDWRWVVAPPQPAKIGEDALEWVCAGATDFWRVTQGHASKHDGQAYLTRVAGDFALEATVEAPLRAQFDQAGLLLERDLEHWVKLGVELDGATWLGAVHTHGTSDWSHEHVGGLPLRLRAERRDGAVTLSAQRDGRLQSFRVLHLPGPLWVGPYACAPRSEGFAARVHTMTLTEAASE